MRSHVEEKSCHHFQAGKDVTKSVWIADHHKLANSLQLHAPGSCGAEIIFEFCSTAPE